MYFYFSDYKLGSIVEIKCRSRIGWLNGVDSINQQEVMDELV